MRVSLVFLRNFLHLIFSLLQFLHYCTYCNFARGSVNSSVDTVCICHRTSICTSKSKYKHLACVYDSRSIKLIHATAYMYIYSCRLLRKTLITIDKRSHGSSKIMSSAISFLFVFVLGLDRSCVLFDSLIIVA